MGSWVDSWDSFSLFSSHRADPRRTPIKTEVIDAKLKDGAAVFTVKVTRQEETWETEKYFVDFRNLSTVLEADHYFQSLHLCLPHPKYALTGVI